MPQETSESKSDADAKATERMISAIFEEMENPGDVFRAVAGTCAIAFAIQWALEYSSRLHWVFGAILCVALAVAFIWFHRFVRRSPLALTRGMCAIHLSFGLMLAIVIAGWVSYTLDALHGDAYVASAHSMGVFMRLYYFTLADVIPVLEVTETLHLKSPAEPRDFVGGFPVLVFKVFVLWFLVEQFTTWRQGRKEAGKERLGDLPLFAVFFLLFVVTVLPGLR